MAAKHSVSERSVVLSTLKLYTTYINIKFKDLKEQLLQLANIHSSNVSDLKSPLLIYDVVQFLFFSFLFNQFHLMMQVQQH